MAANFTASGDAAPFRVFHLHSFDPATGPAEFHDFLAKELDVEPCCVALKGYGSGLANCTWHSEALAATETANVVIWDGDWFADDSFSSFVPTFLARPGTYGVAFRKASGKLEGFLKSWENAPQTKLLLVLVSDECVEQTAVELQQLGAAEAELENLCLGWLTQRVTGANNLAVGGGWSTFMEAKTSLLLQDGPTWKVLPVERRKSGKVEFPSELISMLEASRREMVS